MVLGHRDTRLFMRKQTLMYWQWPGLWVMEIYGYHRRNQARLFHLQAEESPGVRLQKPELRRYLQIHYLQNTVAHLIPRYTLLPHTKTN